ncbi:MAG TPA: hypothetical protein VGM51_13515 [Armatimonadota bacterium]|jgi:hypothetical protein
MRVRLGLLTALSLPLLLAAAPPCLGRVGGLLNLKSQAGQVDVICVGRVAAATAPPQRADGSGSPPADLDGSGSPPVDLIVERVMKGELRPGDHIQIAGDQPRSIYPLSTGHDLVLLLRQGNSYAFARTVENCMPVSGKERTPYLKQLDVLANLRWEIVNSLQDASPAVVQAALAQGALLTKPYAATYVKPLTSNADVTTRALALRVCLKLCDEAPVAESVKLVLSELSRARPSAGLGVFLLRNALYEVRIKGNQVPLFASSLSSPLTEARRFASYMLRLSLRNEAVPLLKSALDDADSEVRYNGVMGLAELTDDHEGHGPAYAIFLKDERPYLTYWREKKVQ